MTPNFVSLVSIIMLLATAVALWKVDGPTGGDKCPVCHTKHKDTSKDKTGSVPLGLQTQEDGHGSD